MNTNNDMPRMLETAQTDSLSGKVTWSAEKSLWYLGNLCIALVGGILTFSLVNFSVFATLTVITLCLGHSLGTHRRLVHNSYQCPLWLEYIFVHLGILIGMAGPLGTLEQHDLRDWAQRKPECHPYLRHGKGFLHDGWWQLNCELRLDHPPKFKAEARVANDPLYQFMERYWMLMQLPWAIGLYLMGGLDWVIWGVCARVSVSLTGHWLIGHFAHNHGPKDWWVEGAAVQGHNIPFTGLITMGECWHNNHHAFPGSAKLGLFPGQSDPGWWVLVGLRKLGLVWDVITPEKLPARTEVKAIGHRHKRPAGIR